MMKNVIITILLVFFAAGGLTAEKRPDKAVQDEIVLPAIKIEKSNAPSDNEASLLVQGSTRAAAESKGTANSMNPGKGAASPVPATGEVD